MVAGDLVVLISSVKGLRGLSKNVIGSELKLRFRRSDTGKKHDVIQIPTILCHKRDIQMKSAQLSVLLLAQQQLSEIQILSVTNNVYYLKFNCSTELTSNVDGHAYFQLKF